MIETAAILYVLAGVLTVEYALRFGWRPESHVIAPVVYAVGIAIVVAWPVFIAAAVRGAVRGMKASR